MMFKPKASYDVKIGDRIYQFICDNDAPLVEADRVVSIIADHVKKLLDDAAKKEQADKEAKEESAKAV